MKGDSLSPSELKVFLLMEDGLTNQEIANASGLTIGTVKTRLYNIYQKLNAHNRISATNEFYKGEYTNV